MSFAASFRRSCFACWILAFQMAGAALSQTSEPNPQPSASSISAEEAVYRYDSYRAQVSESVRAILNEFLLSKGSNVWIEAKLAPASAELFAALPREGDLPLANFGHLVESMTVHIASAEELPTGFVENLRSLILDNLQLSRAVASPESFRIAVDAARQNPTHSAAETADGIESPNLEAATNLEFEKIGLLEAEAASGSQANVPMAASNESAEAALSQRLRAETVSDKTTLVRAQDASGAVLFKYLIAVLLSVGLPYGFMLMLYDGLTWALRLPKRQRLSWRRRQLVAIVQREWSKLKREEKEFAIQVRRGLESAADEDGPILADIRARHCSSAAERFAFLVLSRASARRHRVIMQTLGRSDIEEAIATAKTKAASSKEWLITEAYRRAANLMLTALDRLSASRKEAEQVLIGLSHKNQREFVRLVPNESLALVQFFAGPVKGRVLAKSMHRSRKALIERQVKGLEHQSRATLILHWDEARESLERLSKLYANAGKPSISGSDETSSADESNLPKLYL